MLLTVCFCFLQLLVQLQENEKKINLHAILLYLHRLLTYFVAALIDIPELIEHLQKNYTWWKDQEETMANELEKRQSKTEESQS